MSDSFRKKFRGIYDWTVSEDGHPTPPTHVFPKSVKDRADYFLEMMEDGLTFLGCLSYIFSDEEPEDYRLGATKPWIEKTPEFIEWEKGDFLRSLSQQEMAIYLTYPVWKETEK